MLILVNPTANAGKAAGRWRRVESELRRRDLPFEFMLGALRLKEGFALDQYVQRTGLPLSTVMPTLRDAQQRGLLLWDTARDHVMPSPRGLDFLSDLQALFLPDEGRAASEAPAV